MGTFVATEIFEANLSGNPKKHRMNAVFFSRFPIQLVEFWHKAGKKLFWNALTTLQLFSRIATSCPKYWLNFRDIGIYSPKIMASGTNFSIHGKDANNEKEKTMKPILITGGGPTFCWGQGLGNLEQYFG